MPDAANEPILYLDVNVILDVIDGRRAAASDLLEMIRERAWQAITSPFSILEMIEAKKADRWAEQLLAQGMSFYQVQRRLGERRTGGSRLRTPHLNQVYNELRTKLQPIAEIITFPAPTLSLMNRAEDISASTNIEATDVFHLATALEYACDILVTGDTDFVNLARDFIIAVVPERIASGLDEYRRQWPPSELG